MVSLPREQEKINAKVQFHNTSTLVAIEVNVIIASVMITYYVIAEFLINSSLTMYILNGLFLMIVKSAIPAATGIATSKKIREGILQYFEQLQIVNE